MVQHFILILAALCAVGIVSAQQATRQCTDQSQCGANECCAKRIFRNEAYCVPKRKLGEYCIGGEMGTSLYNGLYEITCPCEPPLLCLEEQIVLSTGEIVPHGNPQCRFPNFDGSNSAYANAGSSNYAGNPYSSSNARSSSYAGNPYSSSRGSSYANAGNPYYYNTGYPRSNAVAYA